MIEIRNKVIKYRYNTVIVSNCIKFRCFRQNVKVFVSVGERKCRATSRCHQGKLKFLSFCLFSLPLMHTDGGGSTTNLTLLWIAERELVLFLLQCVTQ